MSRYELSYFEGATCFVTLYDDSIPVTYYDMLEKICYIFSFENIYKSTPVAIMKIKKERE